MVFSAEAINCHRLNPISPYNPKVQKKEDKQPVLRYIRFIPISTYNKMVCIWKICKASLCNMYGSKAECQRWVVYREHPLICVYSLLVTTQLYVCKINNIICIWDNIIYFTYSCHKGVTVTRRLWVQSPLEAQKQKPVVEFRHLVCNVSKNSAESGNGVC